MKTFLLHPQGLRRGPGCEALSWPWVLVLDGRLAWAAAGPPEGIPEGVPLVQGGWLVEPLADAHVHLFLSGDPDPGERRRVAGLRGEEALDRVLRVLEAYRAAGIAMVRDGGDPRSLALEAARIANREPGRYAAVLPAGEPLFRSGSYGSFLGRGARDVAEAVQLLERNLALGATHAKLLATGLNSLDAAGAVDGGGFAEAELSALLEAARSLGLPAMVHANGALGGLASLLRRGDTVEHGFWMEPGDLRRLAGAGAAWTPTIGAWGALETLALRPEQAGVVRRTLRRQLEAVALAPGAGVELVAGSDAGTPGVEHVSGLLGELARLREAGLPAPLALATSTHSASVRCQEELGRSPGSLEEGQPAGFLWLDGDPVSVPEHLRSPRAVFLGGSWTGTVPRPWEPPRVDLEASCRPRVE